MPTCSRSACAPAGCRWRSTARSSPCARRCATAPGPARCGCWHPGGARRAMRTIAQISDCISAATTGGGRGAAGRACGTRTAIWWSSAAISPSARGARVRAGARVPRPAGLPAAGGPRQPRRGRRCTGRSHACCARWRGYDRYVSADRQPLFVDDEIAVLGLGTARGLPGKNGRVSGRADGGDPATCWASCPGACSRCWSTHHPLAVPRLAGPAADGRPGAPRLRRGGRCRRAPAALGPLPSLGRRRGPAQVTRSARCWSCMPAPRSRPGPAAARPTATT